MSQAQLELSPVPTPFSFKDHPVRTHYDDNQLWFVAKDVCAALGVVWNGRIFSSFPKSWQGMRSFLTPSGNQQVKIISEPAVYKLAFRSNKPEADEFTNWIASEVLPAIRKTGQYNAKAHLTPSTSADRRPLSKLVKAWASTSKVPYAQLWTRVNAHFNLSAVSELPVEWIPDAIAFVEGQMANRSTTLPEAEVLKLTEMHNEIEDIKAKMNLAVRMLNGGCGAMRGCMSALEIITETLTMRVSKL